jgi:2-polyprenyl-3-methyl-5-hydroxy-6-metoxy-1,4-benzoquinol methylase
MIGISRLYAAIERPRRDGAEKLAAAATGFFSLVRSIYSGLWLGMFDREQMAAVTQAYYENPSRPSDRWDEIEYLESGLYRWERDFVEHLPSRGEILVGCAGAGREAFALRRGGFAVTAFDCSEALVASGRAYATENALQVRYEHSAPDEAPRLGSFDGAIIGWGGYGHIVGSSARTGFLKSIREQLKAGAPILLSFTTRSPATRRFKIITAVANFVRRLRFARAIELGDHLSGPGPFSHCFTRDEIVAELEAAGFAVVWFNAKDVNGVKDGYAAGVNPGSP